MIDELDMSVEAMTPTSDTSAPVDHWLARRMHGFGASEMGALALALGREPLPTDTKKLIEDGRMLFARKVRKTLPKLTRAKARERARNLEVERAVLDAWVRMGCPGVSFLDPRSVRHVLECGREEWFPLRDPACFRLTCTPDATARDEFGGLVDISIKSTFETYREGGLLWNYERQSQASLAVQNAAWGVVITGLGFVRENRAEWGGVMVDVVERDEQQIDDLRRMAIDGWARVESLRGAVV